MWGALKSRTLCEGLAERDYSFTVSTFINVANTVEPLLSGRSGTKGRP